MTAMIQSIDRIGFLGPRIFFGEYTEWFCGKHRKGPAAQVESRDQDEYSEAIDSSIKTLHTAPGLVVQLESTCNGLVCTDWPA